MERPKQAQLYVFKSTKERKGVGVEFNINPRILQGTTQQGGCTYKDQPGFSATLVCS